MPIEKILITDIVWLKDTADVALDNGRYWLVVQANDQYLEVASISTGKREGINLEDVESVFREMPRSPEPVRGFSSDEILVMQSMLIFQDDGATREQIANFTSLDLKLVYSICHRLSKQRYLSSRKAVYRLSSGGKKALEG